MDNNRVRELIEIAKQDDRSNIYTDSDYNDVAHFIFYWPQEELNKIDDYFNEIDSRNYLSDLEKLKLKKNYIEKYILEGEGNDHYIKLNLAHVITGFFYANYFERDFGEEYRYLYDGELIFYREESEAIIDHYGGVLEYYSEKGRSIVYSKMKLERNYYLRGNLLLLEEIWKIYNKTKKQIDILTDLQSIGQNQQERIVTGEEEIFKKIMWRHENPQLLVEHFIALRKLDYITYKDEELDIILSGQKKMNFNSENHVELLSLFEAWVADKYIIEMKRKDHINRIYSIFEINVDKIDSLAVTYSKDQYRNRETNRFDHPSVQRFKNIFASIN